MGAAPSQADREHARGLPRPKVGVARDQGERGTTRDTTHSETSNIGLGLVYRRLRENEPGGVLGIQLIPKLIPMLLTQIYHYQLI